MRNTVEEYRPAGLRLQKLYSNDGKVRGWCGPRGVEIEWTDCHIGGARPWMICPACHARRMKLYSLRSGLRCRVCLGLAYLTQQVPKLRRIQIRRERLRRRLGGIGDILEPLPEKPPRMHWRTYARYAQLDARLDDLEWDGMLP